MTTPPAQPTAPKWMRNWLIAAGFYNLLWGAITILAPDLLFDAVGMQLPLYPSIWQCVGMIVGVFGIGYLAAATNPLKHWPIVLVGLLGKVFGPIGFAFAALKGDLPWGFGITILTNDLIWWIPFALILHASYRTLGGLYTEDTAVPTLDQALTNARTSTGQSLLEITTASPTLVVLLRHAGCIFCSQTIATLAKQLNERTTPTPPLVAVHLGTDNDPITELLEKHDLSEAHIVSDPDAELYRALNLKRGSFTELFGPSVALAGMRSLFSGHRVGTLKGDGLRMPGLFLISNTTVLSGQPAVHAGSELSADKALCALPDS